jgi:hypothetical protein
MTVPIRELVGPLPLDRMLRIDVVVDTGRWRRTVRTIWSSDKRSWDIRGIGHGYEIFDWSLELVFDDYWVGLRCSRPASGQRVLDFDVVRELIEIVEGAAARPR